MRGARNVALASPARLRVDSHEDARALAVSTAIATLRSLILLAATAGDRARLATGAPRLIPPAADDPSCFPR
jgi:hypothetical protein